MKLFDTLASRLIASVLAVLIVSQAVSVLLIADQQEDRETDQRQQNFLRQARTAASVLDGVPREAQRLALRPFNSRQTRFTVDRERMVTAANGVTGDELGLFEDSNVPFDQIFVQHFEDPRSLWERLFPPPPIGPEGDAALPFPREAAGGRPPPRPDGAGFRPPPDRGQPQRPGPGGGPPPRLDANAVDTVVSVPLSDGQWINGRLFWDQRPPPWIRPLIAQIILAAVGLTLAVVFLVRHNTKSLSELAVSADRMGRGEDIADLEENGPIEVKRAAKAFNTMAARIKRMVQGRTRMLAAISHDLRTPITSLRIRAELVEDQDNRERMLATLDEMQSLTEATLTLARQDATTEETQNVDLAALVESVCDDLSDIGQPVTFQESPRILYPCRPNTLKRAVRNLVENAVKYGERADVSLSVTSGAGPSIFVDDHGPGIPPEKMKRLFQPFVRLEESRSKETGGFGLGLTIARSIAHAHGGEIALANRDGGGLRATLTLPAANI